MDYSKVINLGHSPNLPLMCPRSELSDGSEPHDLIYLSDAAAVRGGADYRHGREGVPGVEQGGYWEGSIPGTNPVAQLSLIDAYLMNNEVRLVHTAV